MYNGHRFKNMRGSLEWYKEDLFFEEYPLTEEEENNLFQHFKQEKAKGKIDKHAEYHAWKVTAGYPRKWANYFTGSHWYLKPSQWTYDNKLMTQYYKEEYLKTWKGEDIAPCDKDK